MQIAVKSPSAQLSTLVRNLGLSLVCLTIILIFGLTVSSYFSVGNITSLLQSSAISALMFLGLTWVFTIDEMDVSFVAVAALANMITAGLVAAGWDWLPATALALLAGSLVGLANGFIVGVLKIPSLITTIATGGVAASLAAAVGNGASIGFNEPGYLDVLFDTKIGVFSLLTLLVISLVAITWYVQEKLTLGHYIFAIASNEKAAAEAGIRVTAIKVMLFVFAAICSSLAGILIAVELSSGQPSIAQSLFLDGMTAVLLGGTMLRIGRPNVLGTVVGVLIIGALVRGGALLGWNDAVFQVIKGLILVGAVGVVTFAAARK